MNYNMHKVISLLIVTLLLLNCNNKVSELEPADNQENLDSSCSITNLSVEIVSPNSSRDFSHYNDGYKGIFENPLELKQFEGKIQLTYGSNSEILDTSEIDILWKSNIDGVLYEGNPNQNLGSELTTDLSKGVHTIYFEVTI